MKVDDNTLRKIILNIVEKRIKLNSLSKLKELVNAELKKINKDYKVSLERIKKFLSKESKIEIIVETKKSREIDFCPICSSRIIPIKSINLNREEIVVGYKCEKCNFKTFSKNFLPRRYNIIFKKNSRV